jgi:hypothetical protein
MPLFSKPIFDLKFETKIKINVENILKASGLGLLGLLALYWG